MRPIIVYRTQPGLNEYTFFPGESVEREIVALFNARGEFSIEGYTTNMEELLTIKDLPTYIKVTMTPKDIVDLAVHGWSKSIGNALGEFYSVTKKEYT